jgi:succinate dehydrogenase/fumarate reductase cytochrome b subunit
MSLFFKVMAFIVMLGVVGALFMGLRNMMKDGSANYSNKMMQLRVLLQAVAIVLLVAAVYFGRPA